MNPYKKFLCNFIFATAGFSLLVAIFCCITDPYEIWHFYSRRGFNLYSVKGENIERLTKPLNFIFHHSHDKTIIFGSSRADYALNPATWENLTGNATYNFSVTSATVYELRRYFENVIAVDSEIKEIIFCADFFMFIDTPQNKQEKFLPGFDEAQIGKKFPTLENLQKIIFSWESVKDGFTNCKKNFTDAPDYPCHELNGKFSDKYIENHYNNDPQKFFSILQHWKKNINFAESFIVEERLEDLKKIAEICKEKNIQLYICILPLYPLHYECFKDCWNVYDEWKEKLTAINAVYDFTCSDENITRRENFWDTSHVKSNIGNKILKSMQSGNLEFGEILTEKNIQLHNKKIFKAFQDINFH